MNSSKDIQDKISQALTRLARWWALAPSKERLAAATLVSFAVAPPVWISWIAPGLQHMRSADADEEATSRSPEIALVKVDPAYERDKAAFERRKAERSVRGTHNSFGPAELARIGRLAGPALVGVSVDTGVGYPRAAVAGYEHVLELRLAGSWEALSAVTSTVEPLVSGRAVELVIDQVPDGRLALRARWNFTTPSRDWGVTDTPSPPVPKSDEHPRSPFKDR